MPLDLDLARKHLQDFDFKNLFIEDLGWARFQAPPRMVNVKKLSFRLTPLAEMSGVAVFEAAAPDGAIPDAKTRAALQKEVSRQHHENLLLFVDAERTSAIWYWVKRDRGRTQPRDHYYFRGQSPDLLLSKIHSIVIEWGDFEDNDSVPIVKVARKLAEAFDIQPVIKRFYTEFKDFHAEFVEQIGGIDHEVDRRWYASVLLNRIMFVWFLQKKHLIDHDPDYLVHKLEESKKRGKDRFFSEFLRLLFFAGFARQEKSRSEKAKKLLGDVRYLNGGLFLHHSLELKYKTAISIADKAFEQLFALFKKFSWHLDDRHRVNPTKSIPMYWAISSRNTSIKSSLALIIRAPKSLNIFVNARSMK
jgi:hypothetical protein